MQYQVQQQYSESFPTDQQKGYHNKQQVRTMYQNERVFEQQPPSSQYQPVHSHQHVQPGQHVIQEHTHFHALSNPPQQMNPNEWRRVENPPPQVMRESSTHTYVHEYQNTEVPRHSTTQHTSQTTYQQPAQHTIMTSQTLPLAGSQIIYSQPQQVFMPVQQVVTSSEQVYRQHQHQSPVYISQVQQPYIIQNSPMIQEPVLYTSQTLPVQSQIVYEQQQQQQASTFGRQSRIELVPYEKTVIEYEAVDEKDGNENREEVHQSQHQYQQQNVQYISQPPPVQYISQPQVQYLTTPPPVQYVQQPVYQTASYIQPSPVQSQILSTQYVPQIINSQQQTQIEPLYVNQVGLPPSSYVAQPVFLAPHPGQQYITYSPTRSVINRTGETTSYSQQQPQQPKSKVFVEEKESKSWLSELFS